MAEGDSIRGPGGGVSGQSVIPLLKRGGVHWRPGM